MAKRLSKDAQNFKGSLNYDHLRRSHQKYLKKLNDVLVETALTIQGINSVAEDVSTRMSNGETVYTLKVPNKLTRMIPIRRNMEKLHETLNDETPRNLYIRSIVFLISLTEDYLATNVRTLLCAYPHKLLISPKGNKLRDTDPYSIDVRDLLEAKSIDLIVKQLADQRIRDAMYASPSQYISYFRKISGIEIKQKTYKSYVEIKARRDLFIHGDGKINQIYIEKISSGLNLQIGDDLSVDADYFRSTSSSLKALLSEIYTGMRNNFADSVELKTIFDLHPIVK